MEPRPTVRKHAQSHLPVRGLPSQVDTPEQLTLWQGPYRKLILGILYTAISDCCMVGSKVTTDDQRDAYAWVHCGNDAPWGFLWVCEMLDMDAYAVQDSITPERLPATAEALRYINQRTSRYIETRANEKYTKKEGHHYGRKKGWQRAA